MAKYRPPGFVPANEAPPATPAASSYRPPGFVSRLDAPAAPPDIPSTRDEITAAQQRKAAFDQIGTIRMAAENLPKSVRALIEAQVSGDEQEIMKGTRNYDQAFADFSRLLGGADKVENETPIVGDGTGLEQVGNALGAFFVPFRQVLRQQALGPAPGSGKSPAGELASRIWEQIKHPSLRQNAGDVAGEVWDAKGKPALEATTAPAMRSQADRIRAILATPPSQYADPAFVASQRAMRADEAGKRAWGERNPSPTTEYLGITKPTAQVGAEVAEMALPTPGSAALGLAGKAVGKGLGAGLRAAGKLSDKTQPGRRLLDSFTHGGALRRVDEALKNNPVEAGRWSSAALQDQLLEMEVATARKQGAMADRLTGLFQPLSPAERTLAIDAVEHPELLSGNPQLLEALAQQGVDVTGHIAPTNTPSMARLWANAPTVAQQVADKAAKAGLWNPQSPFGKIVGQVGAHKLPPDILADWLERTGAARPDIKKLWPVRRGLRDLHEETRAARAAVDPLARTQAEPYITHASDQAAERALGNRGINVAALDEAERSGKNAAQHGFVTRPGLTVHKERGRALNEKLADWTLDADLSDNLEPNIAVPSDTRLPMNRAMSDVLGPHLQQNRDFFSGRVQPQASKLARDIQDTEVLRFLESLRARGKDVSPHVRATLDPVTGAKGKQTVATADKLTGAPGGAGNFRVPQTDAWERISQGKKVAVPIPVAEAVENLHALGGKGFYDTLVDTITGRAPTAARVAGKLFSPLSELFKIPATVMNPRYYIRNAGGNYDQMFKKFGANAFNPDDAALAEELIRGEQGAGTGLARRVKGPGGQEISLGELRDLMERRGMLGDAANPKIPIGPSIEQKLADIDLRNPRATAVLRSLNPFKPSVNPIVQGAAEIFGRGPEEAARAQSLVRAFKNTGDATKAARTVDELLFNPNRTSEAMQRLSGVFPFIRWWGKNIPLQAKLATEHPNRVYAVTDRLPEISRRAALSPEDYDESKRRPVGKYLAQSPLYWTGMKDSVKQPVVMPFPFSTEGELYDMAEVGAGALRDVKAGDPLLPLARERAMTALLQRGNPVLAQLFAEPNRDVLRERDINLELRDPNGEVIGYQESTGKAGAFSEGLHRAAERNLGWPAGKQLPLLATSRAPMSPYVMQDASVKRMLEMVPLLNAFPLSTLRVFDQNSNLEPLARVPAVFGTGLQSVPWYQTERNRPFQTQAQIKHQRQTTRQKTGR